MKTSEQVNEIFKALVKAQGESTNAVKGSENPYFKSKYADLASIIEVTKKPLFENGLAVIQSPTSETGVVTVITRIIHQSGQWIEGSLSFTVAKSDPQSVGSAITYGRRYSLASMMGITQEDDDGNAGSAPSTKPDPLAQRYSEVVKGINSASTQIILDAVKESAHDIKWSDEQRKNLTVAFNSRKKYLETMV